MAGLCYDTPPVEAMPFPIDISDKPPRALSEDFYQEKLPSQPLVERFKQLPENLSRKGFVPIIG
jgi:hypothetical protein